MVREARIAFGRLQSLFRKALCRIEVIALFPVMVLLAYATGQVELVLAAAMVLPSLLAIVALGQWPEASAYLGAAGMSGAAYPTDRGTMVAMLERIASMPGWESACFVLEMDDWDGVTRRIGAETARDVAAECEKRLRAALRSDDLVAQVGHATFGIVLHPVASVRLGIRDAIANRLCAGLSAPIGIGETTLRLTASVGHAALPASGRLSAEDTVAGAALALEEAKAAGPGSVRSFVPSTIGKQCTQSQLTEEVPTALASGAILAWFQPQIDVRTGAVAGFEALARWEHASLGLLGPGQFLTAVENAGRMEEMGARIRQQALTALKSWHAAGHLPVTVSVNACGSELRNPSYAEEVAWDLDAAGVAPEQLIIEVLESVVGDARDDSIVATLGALRSQGIGLDLDDFGVGQASLLSIRRFGVGRIKIDRSFVTGIDQDPEQQAMVGGIVSLGRTMGLETLAEGVETPMEEATLTRLGCTYVQGFGIAKPMTLSQTLDWLETSGFSNARDAARPGQIHSAE